MFLSYTYQNTYITVQTPVETLVYTQIDNAEYKLILYSTWIFGLII